MTKLGERRINETRNYLKTNHDVVFSYSMLSESLRIPKAWLTRNLDVIAGDDKHMVIYYDRGRRVGIKYCSNHSDASARIDQRSAKERALELLKSTVVSSLSDRNYISGKELAKKLEISEVYLRQEREYFLKGCPDLEYTKLQGYRRKAKNIETESRYGDKKNDEGYNDGTAFKAISGHGKALAGEIWEYELPRGEKTNVLVINSNKRIAQILFLSDNEDTVQKTMEHPVKLEVGNKTYFYDPMLVQSRKQWYLRSMICTLNIDIFNEVRGKIMEAMGMPDRVVTVEKVVEKEVPVEVEKVVIKKVPVEKIVEVKTPVIPNDDNLDTLKAIELAKLRTEVEIYKNFCNGFMDIMRGSAGLVKGGE